MQSTYERRVWLKGHSNEARLHSASNSTRQSRTVRSLAINSFLALSSSPLCKWHALELRSFHLFDSYCSSVCYQAQSPSSSTFISLFSSLWYLLHPSSFSCFETRTKKCTVQQLSSRCRTFASRKWTAFINSLSPSLALPNYSRVKKGKHVHVSFEGKDGQTNSIDTIRYAIQVKTVSEKGRRSSKTTLVNSSFSTCMHIRALPTKMALQKLVGS